MPEQKCTQPAAPGRSSQAIPHQAEGDREPEVQGGDILQMQQTLKKAVPAQSSTHRTGDFTQQQPGDAKWVCLSSGQRSRQE